MVCPTCGTAGSPQSDTCPECGTAFETTAVTELPTQSQTPGESQFVPDEALAHLPLLGDRYKRLKLLGKGGMGEVYKAHDIVQDRLVALKTIRQDLARRPEVRERFLKEVKLAQDVTHPNVVR